MPRDVRPAAFEAVPRLATRNADREKIMSTIQTVLCATDFSDSARHAFDLACSLAKAYDARLILAHVIDEEYGKQSFAGNEIEIRPSDHPKRVLELLEGLKAPDPSVQVEHVVAEGAPVDEILRLAKERAADLVVIGTHGLTGLKRLVLGSVAEQLVRRAHCPVVTTKLSEGDAAPAETSS
jgi:nucleotide-binding universal stress UspA family protein